VAVAGAAATGAGAAASVVIAGAEAGAAVSAAAGAAVSTAIAAVCPNTSNNTANAPIIALLQMNRSLIILPPLDFELLTHNVFFGASGMGLLITYSAEMQNPTLDQILFQPFQLCADLPRRILTNTDISKSF
jgi:hypothetical protein